MYYAKVFGERNSGTNYVQQLIRQNFYCEPLLGDTQKAFYTYFSKQETGIGGRYLGERIQDIEHGRILFSDFGWKHACPPVNVIRTSNHAKYTVFIFVVKNPYFWIRSFHERSYHYLGVKKPVQLSDFMRSQWITVERDNLDCIRLSSPLDLWVRKSESYISFQRNLDLKSVMVRYEDFLTEFDEAMGRLSRFMVRRGEKYKNVDASTKKDLQTYDDYRKKYSEEKIRTFLSDDDIQFVNNRIPRDLFSSLGYSRID